MLVRPGLVRSASAVLAHAFRSRRFPSVARGVAPSRSRLVYTVHLAMDPWQSDSIRISGLEVDCILGLRPLERRRRQSVRLDLELFLDLRPAALSGRIQDTVDYSRLAEEAAVLLKFRAYQLLEEASEELAAMALAAHPVARAVRIRLEKPAALPGRAHAASVELRRSSDELSSERRSTPFGHVRTVLRTSEAELSVIAIEPGRALAAPDPDERRCEWLVQGCLTADGHAVPLFKAWRRGREDTYRAEGPTPALVFSCLAGNPVEPGESLA